MQLNDFPSPDHAATAERVAALEAENAALRQGLADAGLRNRHMLHELQHRARNTFAVVRSIVRRTATTSHTVEDYAMHLTGRLDAVARAEAMTSFDPQGSACLQNLLLEELLAHAVEEGEQVSLGGPTVRLRGKAAEMLALALHELTVNAVKFGALSTPEGRVDVRWDIDPAPAGDAAGEGRVLRLAWREAGAGVADAPPGPGGFGMEMIERTLAYELGATTSLGFGREGAWCDIAVPLTDAIVVAGCDSLALLPGASSLARKLALFVPLSDADRGALDALLVSEERFAADADIVAEGETPRSVFLVQAGMAMRYRSLPDGRRQIMTFLIPGDLCNPHMFLLGTMDHSIATLSPVRIAALSHEALLETFATRPRVSAALWWSRLQEEAMLRERIVSLGRRDARGRIAHLLCELLWRYDAMGLAEGEMYRLPLTQTELGDAVGLTPVHVNRVLRDFREQRLIAMEHRVLKVLDVEGLQAVAAFNKEYLHLDRAPPDVARYFDRLEHDEDRLHAAGR